VSSRWFGNTTSASVPCDFSPLRIKGSGNTESERGQSAKADLSGTVSDVSGAAISDAVVDAISQATNALYSGKTNKKGIYHILDLPEGPYVLHISKAGFRTVLRFGIVLHPQDMRALNATLRVGDPTEIDMAKGGITPGETEPKKVKQTEAGITGMVRDATAAHIPDAVVDAINQGTNVLYSRKTNQDGIYQILGLPEGTYALHISKAGFRTVLQFGIVLHPQDMRALNATLRVGEARFLSDMETEKSESTKGGLNVMVTFEGRTHPQPPIEAIVDAINQETNVRYSGETNDFGLCQILDLPEGTYELRISSPGFRTVLRSGIAVNLHDIGYVEVNLQIVR